MKIELRVHLGLALALLTSAAFLAGRRFEEKRMAARIENAPPQPAAPEAALQPRPIESYRALAINDILALPFADFYEALRAAPKSAREKWAGELEAMPKGPRHYAAASAFYKLLVQFDPAAAAKAISEIKDRKMQTSALLTVVAAAPSSALPEMARLGFSLPHEVWPDYISGFPYDLLTQWSEVDPEATALFIDNLPEDDRPSYKFSIVRDWAAVDPAAAWAWAGKQEGASVTGSLFDGWYDYNREAAVSYALAHATEKLSQEALPALLQRLYQDSPTAAKDFLEQLPSDELRRTAFEHFDFMDNIASVESTGQPELEPRTLAEWITQFPSELWKGSLSGIFRQWRQSPPQEVIAWIQQQPAEIRDAVAAEYQEPGGKTVPEAAQAIFQFASPELQDRLLTAMLSKQTASEEEFQKSISTSALTPAQQQHLLDLASVVAEAKKADEAKKRAADEAVRAN